MFCTKPLGENAVIEFFPVGRRLAFDGERGRLWVVCTKCERWNLTPLEERWEAVEECERIFRDTRVRVSTENIGLARHPEGLSLVRIGKPLRPEFAAWRYGDQFGRRRRRKLVYGTAALVAVGGIAAGGVAAGVGGAMLLNAGQLWVNSRNLFTVVKLRPDSGRVIKLRRLDLYATRIRPGDEHTFTLQISKAHKTTCYRGAEAQRLAGTLLPKINAMGGTQDAVQQAVGAIEHAGHPERFLTDIAQGDRFHHGGIPVYIAKMPKPTRLALEMSLHEEQERRALEGELRLLERAWEEAEEIAAISDNLVLPKGAEDFIRKHRLSDAQDGAR